ncbi:uncharacterized protein A4U43_C04F690 [Asparagus officinalis]|uniref:Uncharacterized protein n=1 Tax=Asparagus officinalis TaxID=4686 RepID=A0A5P1EZY2_ASPOF|nr:uncharacterized protein A4U43_C04F690 [Asparagus officinalis]
MHNPCVKKLLDLKISSFQIRLQALGSSISAFSYPASVHAQMNILAPFLAISPSRKYSCMPFEENPKVFESGGRVTSVERGIFFYVTPLSLKTNNGGEEMSYRSGRQLSKQDACSGHVSKMNWAGQ